MSERELSVIVFGAGGYTGRRVAGYLAERAAETGLRWAPAGRSPERIASQLEADGVSGAPEPIAADVEDPSSLEAMAARTAVVLNLVGPYTTYGEPVIEACIRAGTHYADLTGEIPFAQRMLARHGEAAREAGVKIVQICGFEALPPDICAQLAVAEAGRRWPSEQVVEVETRVSMRPPPGGARASDGISGGTAQSMAAVMGGEAPEAIRDPAALVDDPARAEQVRRRSPIATLPRREDGAVVAPMQPAAYINPAVVQRTAALLAAEAAASGDGEGGPEPAPFRYREGIALHGGTASLLPRFALAGALSVGQALFALLAAAPAAVRSRIAQLLSRVLPSSGAGPAADRLEGWRWGVTANAETSAGRSVTARLEAVDHPGYLATARMLGEAGMLLAEPGATPERAGFLTPATALGTDRLDRFERAGLRFSIE